MNLLEPVDTRAAARGGPSTGLVTHERYFWHDTGTSAGILPAGGWLQPYHHFDHAETKRRLRNLIDASGLSDRLTSLRPRPATEGELRRLHSAEHVARIRAGSAHGGDAGDGESPFGPGGFDIAALAAGGVLTAVDAVVDGVVDKAYALVRPPGHHALADSGMGFCLFNNLALGVLHARQARGVAKVAVIDWDVHHGNGIQEAFYADPTVLTISLHQEDLYPVNSGRVSERGRGAGEGFTVNVPLPAGSGAGAYEDAMTRVVVPAVDAFAPDLIMVACGYDANAYDPLGRMSLHSGVFRHLAREVVALADRLCGGKLILVQEGGYSAVYVPFCGLAVLEALSGERTDVVDPYLDTCLRGPGNAQEPHQRASVDAALAGVDLALLNRPSG